MKKQRIIIKKTDAIEFFGSIKEICMALGISAQAVSQWGEHVPQDSAWPMLELSRMPGYQDNGKLKAIINL